MRSKNQKNSGNCLIYTTVICNQLKEKKTIHMHIKQNRFPIYSLDLLFYWGNIDYCCEYFCWKVFPCVAYGFLLFAVPIVFTFDCNSLLLQVNMANNVVAYWWEWGKESTPYVNTICSKISILLIKYGMIFVSPFFLFFFFNK